MTGWAAELERDLSWREAELASLKHFVIASRHNPVAYKGALRAIWTMLYAHYEGFTKFCWDLVVDEIQRASIPRADLKECVAILSLEEFFSRTRGNTSSENLWRVFNHDIPSHLAIPARFPADHRLKTDSNLWPNGFRAENAKLGITCRELDANESRLATLVARRNKIAHGESMTISSIDDYRPYETVVTLVMHELAVAVLDYLDDETYRK